MHLKKLQTLNDILKTIIESGNTDTRALDQMEGDGQTLMEKCLRIWMSKRRKVLNCDSLIAEEGCVLSCNRN